jgi:hypothetical protein
VAILPPHIFARVSLCLARGKKKIFRLLNSGNDREEGTNTTIPSPYGFVRERFLEEFTPSSNRVDIIVEFKFTRLYICLNTLALFFGLCHYIWVRDCSFSSCHLNTQLTTYAQGTSIFAGILFIETRDAVFVLMKYFASVLLCKFVIWFETGGLRRRTGKTKTVGWIAH